MQVSIQAFQLLSRGTLVTLALLMIGSNVAFAQQGPPELGQETKGTPAIDETAPVIDEQVTADDESETEDESQSQTRSGIDGLLGKAEITESKRESGQVYLIELEHSSGTKQYIEETDSDGKIESTSNDIEETPNLPKWKLGSW